MIDPALFRGEPGKTRRPHWTAFAHGKPRKAGEMNGTETAYNAYLEGQKVLGLVVWFAFQPMSFRLGPGATYRPDFAVMLTSGLIRMIEVKGFWAEAAKVRIKVAAGLYPFDFVAVRKRPKKSGGGWEEIDFSSGDA